MYWSVVTWPFLFRLRFCLLLILVCYDLWDLVQCVTNEASIVKPSHSLEEKDHRSYEYKYEGKVFYLFLCSFEDLETCMTETHARRTSHIRSRHISSRFGVALFDTISRWCQNLLQVQYDWSDWISLKNRTFVTTRVYQGNRKLHIKIVLFYSRKNGIAEEGGAIESTLEKL